MFLENGNFLIRKMQYVQDEYIDNVYTLHNLNNNFLGSVTSRFLKKTQNFMIINFGVCESKKGYGTILLKEILKKIEMEATYVLNSPLTVYCEIETNNISSQKLFRKFKFRKINKDNDLIQYFKSRSDVLLLSKRIKNG